MRKHLLLLLAFFAINARTNAVQAQSFVGQWSDEQALKTWIGGNFYYSAQPSEWLGTQIGVIDRIDTCVSHLYKGKVKFNGKQVFTQVLGKFDFKTKDNSVFKWLITGTTDGYDCDDCGVSLSGSLWEFADKKWSILLEERDFAQRGNSGIAPLIDFAIIGNDEQLGVFVWERSMLDSVYHFYKGDIFTPINRQFVQITGSNYHLDSRLPNICSAVSSNSDIPYNYESDYEFLPNPKSDINDLKIRQQGTEWQEDGVIVPFNIDYTYTWGGSSYVLRDSVANQNYTAYTVKTGLESFFTVAKLFNLSADDVKEDNPIVAMRASSLLRKGEVLFIRKKGGNASPNLEPTTQSIEAAVGVPLSDVSEDGARKQDKKNAKSPVSTLETTTNGLLSHRVQPGETLFGLCKKYGVQMTNIKIYNDLPDDYSIKVGQLLILERKETKENTGTQSPFPAKNTPKNSPENATIATEKASETPQQTDEKTPSKSPSKISETPQQFHIVHRGETMFSIARMYNAQIHLIQELNKMTDYTLFKGQKLRIK